MSNLHEAVFLETGFLETTPWEFYHDLFSRSSAFHRYDHRMQMPVTFSEEAGGTWRSVALSDLSSECADHRDAYVSACTYFPHKNRDGHWRSLNGRDHADELCAFVVDIDHGDPNAVRTCIKEADYYWEMLCIPEPTYMVCSGHGLHLYFVLDTPVKMLKRWQLELDRINRCLNERLTEPFEVYGLDDEEDWNEGFLGSVDRHGLTQPYRVVGSLPKEGYDEVSAWQTGDTTSIEVLAQTAGLHHTVFTEEGFNFSTSLLSRKMTEQQNRKVYTKKTNRKGWNPGFYQWLARREKEHARLYGEYGHRYKQVQALSIAAVKDRIPKEQLTQDVRELFQAWNNCSKKYGHPEITWGECEKAMKSFQDCPDHRRFPKWWLEELCGWEFGTQKRNGRSQTDHLEKVARPIRRAYLDAGREDVSGGGRPKGSGTKRAQIVEYAIAHPDANHSEIARALGVSRPTVIKWLKDEVEKGSR